MSDARNATGGHFVGQSYGIDPSDSDVQSAARAIGSNGTSFEAALRAFQWMNQNLRFQDSRGDQLQPLHQVLSQKFGSCRELAATYASILRALGIPARIVTGYLGTGAQGFHAWIEFYGGPMNSLPSWIPVDVSTIGGTTRTATALGFAFQRAENVPFRTWNETGLEWPVWAASTTSSTSAWVMPGSTSSFESPQWARLCVDGKWRRTLTALDACPSGLAQAGRALLAKAAVRIQYGFNVTMAPHDTLMLKLLRPELRPDLLRWEEYGSTWSPLAYGDPFIETEFAMESPTQAT